MLSYTWVDTYKNFYSKTTIKKVTNVWHSIKNLSQQTKNPKFYFAVAKIDKGKIIGLITVRKVNDNTIFMQRLYVHPKYQRQGVGKKLMDKSVKYFSAKKIKLEVEERNVKGISFYMKNGFKKIGKKKEKVEGEEAAAPAPAAGTGAEVKKEKPAEKK